MAFYGTYSKERALNWLTARESEHDKQQAKDKEKKGRRPVMQLQTGRVHVVAKTFTCTHPLNIVGLRPAERCYKAQPTIFPVRRLGKVAKVHRDSKKARSIYTQASNPVKWLLDARDCCRRCGRYNGDAGRSHRHDWLRRNNGGRGFQCTGRGRHRASFFSVRHRKITSRGALHGACTKASRSSRCSLGIR